MLEHASVRKWSLAMKCVIVLFMLIYITRIVISSCFTHVLNSNPWGCLIVVSCLVNDIELVFRCHVKFFFLVVDGRVTSFQDPMHVAVLNSKRLLATIMSNALGSHCSYQLFCLHPSMLCRFIAQKLSIPR